MATLERQRKNFMEAPSEGWLHDERALKVGQGVYYSYPVTYVGYIDLAESLRLLTLPEQTMLTRALIAKVVEECGARNAREPLSLSHKLQAFLKGNIHKAMVDVNLGIAAEGIVIAPVDAGEDGTGKSKTRAILAFHAMQWISLAAGGEMEDYDMMAYVAKDSKGNRACHVFDCGLLSDDALATIGQAFTLAQGKKAEAAKKKLPALKKRPPPAPEHMIKGGYRDMTPQQREEYLSLGPKGRDKYMELTPEEREAYMDLTFIKDKAVYLQLEKDKRSQYLQIEPSGQAQYLEAEASQGDYFPIGLGSKNPSKGGADDEATYLSVRDIMDDDYMAIGLVKPAAGDPTYLETEQATGAKDAKAKKKEKKEKKKKEKKEKKKNKGVVVAYDTPEEGTVELYGAIDEDDATYMAVEQLARAGVDPEDEIYLDLKDDVYDDMYLSLNYGAPVPEQVYHEPDPKRLVGILNKRDVLVNATEEVVDPLKAAGHKHAQGKKPKWRVFSPEEAVTMSLEDMCREFQRTSIRGEPATRM
eukprot:m.486366 g.486366  ORF g.486366 m.486366 type:complete len:529 (-) comp24357_c0_seq1:47-1633(-)